MRAWVLAGVAACAWLGGAQAATITRTYDFEAHFTSGPNPTVSAEIGVTYDPTGNAPAVVDSFASAVLGTYIPVSAYVSSGVLYFGNDSIITPAGFTFSVNPSKNDFYGYLGVDAGGAPTGYQFLSYAVDGSLYSTRNVTASSGAVPEPATWAMMVGGFGLVGGALRRRRPGIRFA